MFPRLIGPLGVPCGSVGLWLCCCQSVYYVSVFVVVLCWLSCPFPPSPSFLYVSYLWKNGAPGRRFSNVTVCILHHLWQKGRGPPSVFLYVWMCVCNCSQFVLLDVLAVSPCLCSVSYVCSVLWFALCGCFCLFLCFVRFVFFAYMVCMRCMSFSFLGKPWGHNHTQTQKHTTTHNHTTTQKHTETHNRAN